MCGIIGITGERQALVKEAARAMEYRGPDASGVFSDGRMTLGHNRLSVIDLDARSNQPFFDAAGETGIVFNGEIYNFLQLRTELEQTGKYQFRTSSDTEVLLYSYKEWGSRAVEHLRGMFAFAVYDRPAGKVILCSDLAAIKPLYFAARPGMFAFASELKATLMMLKTQGGLPAVDRQAVELYFAHGYVPAPRTLYDGVRRLPPRTIVTYDCDSGVLEETTYTLSDDASGDVAAVREEIEQSVKAHLIADVPVGVFFSGGTDSSLIAAALHQQHAPVEVFSVQVAGRTADKPYFEAIAKELGIKAHVVPFDQAAFERSYQEVLARLDEPLADNSLLPTYAVSRFAAGRVKVVLSGEGGDEFFWGYPRSLALNRMAGARVRWGWPERAYTLLPHFFGKDALFARLFVALRRPLSYYLLVMSPAHGLLAGSAWRAAWHARAQENIAPGEYDAAWYMPNDLLRKTDLATMYASIEGRVPLVDRRVIAAARAAGAPDISERDTKPLLKKILTAYLPAHLVYRKKSGFGLHLPEFFAASPRLRQDVADALSFLRGRGLLPLRRMPSVGQLLTRYPNLAWAALVLARVVRNNETL